MSDDRSAFDPRFDPAFQRGYDGVPGDAGTAVPQSVAAAVPDRPASTPEPRITPLAEAPAALFPPARRSPAEEPEDDRDPRGLNRWFLALAAVSAALILGGLLLISRLRDLFADTQNSSEFDYVVLQTLIIGAPILVSLGIATAIGLLFALALRRR